MRALLIRVLLGSLMSFAVLLMATACGDLATIAEGVATVVDVVDASGIGTAMDGDEDMPSDDATADDDEESDDDGNGIDLPDVPEFP